MRAPLPEEWSLRELLRTFTYRPGWTFDVVESFLFIKATVVDTDNPKQMIPLSFHAVLPVDVRDDFDWTRWLFHQIMIVEEHEAREFFKINGVKVFDPHG